MKYATLYCGRLIVNRKKPTEKTEKKAADKKSNQVTVIQPADIKANKIMQAYSQTMTKFAWLTVAAIILFVALGYWALAR